MLHDSVNNLKKQNKLSPRSYTKYTFARKPSMTKNKNLNNKNQEFKVGTSVLIYKPIRKIGKSEILLHRWLGPYEVIRRISDLNYEVN